MDKERTLVILKPDTIQRNLMGEVMKRFENRGMKIIGLKMGLATEEKIFEHYNKDDEWFTSKGEGIIKAMETAGEKPEKEAIEYGKDIIGGLAKYMTAGPSVFIVYEGYRAIDAVRRIAGTTEPTTSDIGSIRGDYGVDSFDLCALQGNRGLRNLLHASEDAEDAEREIKLWFNDDELINYTHVLDKILYDINLDGILE